MSGKYQYSREATKICAVYIRLTNVLLMRSSRLVWYKSKYSIEESLKLFAIQIVFICDLVQVLQSKSLFKFESL